MFICLQCVLMSGLYACQPQSVDRTSIPETMTAAPDTYTDYPEATRVEFQKCDIDEDEFYRLMGLSYRDFDQDFKGGWRAIDYKDGCGPVAAHILKSYLTASKNRFTDHTSSVKWHAGQVLAGIGRYEEARTYFEQTYKSADSLGDWNLYVDGTIAFIKRDKSALIAARDKLAKIPVPEALKNARRQFLKDNPNITMPKGFIDEPGNLSVLNQLITCFDKPYSEAYGKCGKSPHD